MSGYSCSFLGGQRLAALLVLAMMGAGTAHACRARQPGMDRLPDELIAAARAVSVARVVQATAFGVDEVRYDFVVLKRMAGPYRERFSIVSRSTPADDVAGSYDHGDEAFWQRGGGRLGGESNFCHITPRFDVGQAYLVFHDKPYTYRSFERIHVSPDREPISDDKWFSHVAEKLRWRTIQ